MPAPRGRTQGQTFGVSQPLCPGVFARKDMPRLRQIAIARARALTLDPSRLSSSKPLQVQVISNFISSWNGDELLVSHFQFRDTELRVIASRSGCEQFCTALPKQMSDSRVSRDFDPGLIQIQGTIDGLREAGYKYPNDSTCPSCHESSLRVGDVCKQEDTGHELWKCRATLSRLLWS